MLKEEQALVDRLEESMMGIALREGADDRLRRLAMGGLIEKSEYSKFVRLMKSLKSKDELSPELRILIDHFTFNSLYFAFAKHPLAFFILLSYPYLYKKLNN